MNLENQNEVPNEQGSSREQKFSFPRFLASEKFTHKTKFLEDCRLFPRKMKSRPIFKFKVNFEFNQKFHSKKDSIVEFFCQIPGKKILPEYFS